MTQQRFQSETTYEALGIYLFTNDDDPLVQRYTQCRKSYMHPHILVRKHTLNQCLIHLFFSESEYSYKNNLNFVKHKIKSLLC